MHFQRRRYVIYFALLLVNTKFRGNNVSFWWSLKCCYLENFVGCEANYFTILRKILLSTIKYISVDWKPCRLFRIIINNININIYLKEDIFILTGIIKIFSIWSFWRIGSAHNSADIR